MTNLEIIKAAAAQRLTVGGVRVAVSGASEPYATVTIADSRHPFRGWSTTYSWPTVQRAVEGDGTLLA